MIYAVGDIHGQKALLEDALERIERDGGPDARIVFLGDYVDRGPDSAGVIELLVNGINEGRNWVCLKGNHDRLFEWFLQDPPRHDQHLIIGMHWFHKAIGGIETMASYGVHWEDRARLSDVAAQARETVPPHHVSFLKSLALSFEDTERFFVHAGIRPNVPLDAQTEEDLVWIRQEFHNFKDPHPKLIIHGHTPVDAATHYGNRVNLDTGAGYGRPLSIAAFEGDDCWFLGGKGREKLLPQDQ